MPASALYPYRASGEDKAEDKDMKCRGCDRELVDGEDYRMVAEWPFCPSCFEDLMKGSLKPAGPQIAEQTEPTPAAVEPGPAPVLCSVCKRQLKPEEGRKLGIWNFCLECYGELESLAFGGEESEEEDAGKEVPEEGQPGGILGATVELSKYVSCKNCGRRIPLGGSRTVEGEPYCPDCYYALVETEEKETATPVPPSPEKTDQSDNVLPENAGYRCACCDRPLHRESSREVEGFVLCGACRETDLDLALRIARERHRRLLAGLSAGLEDR